MFQYEKWLAHVSSLVCHGDGSSSADITVDAMRDAASAFRVAVRKIYAGESGKGKTICQYKNCGAPAAYPDPFGGADTCKAHHDELREMANHA